MRKTFALTCLVAVVLAGCGPKTQNAANATASTESAPAPADNAPAPTQALNSNAPTPLAPLPALAKASPDACAVAATYVKVEMKGDFGMAMQARVAPEKTMTVAAGELTKAFPGLKGADAKTLAEGMTRLAHDGSQFDCDWKALGLGAPTAVTPETQGFIRFRPAVAGDVAVLETYTEAGAISLASRCLYRRQAGAWVRNKCVLTKLS